MKDKKIGEKICLHCRKTISNKVKRTRVTTFMEDGDVKHEWFHWQCWIECYKKAVARKTKQIVGTATQGAKSVVNKLLGGTEQVENFIDNMGASMDETISKLPD